MTDKAAPLPPAEPRRARSPQVLTVLPPEEVDQLLSALREHQRELERQNQELRAMQAQLEAERARYSDLYDRAPVGYVTVSEQGVILEANLTAALMLGVSRNRLAGALLTRYIVSEDEGLYLRHRNLLFETGVPQACELRMARQDESVFWALLEASSTQNDCGATVCRVVISDFTEQRKAEDSLKEAWDQAEMLNAHLEQQTLFATSMAARSEQSNAAKSEFLAKMSDALRPPLNALLDVLGLLLASDLSDVQRMQAETARASGETLLAVLNEFHTFAKLGSGV